MKRIDRETVQKILDTADIVEVVSDFVHLKRRGANYMGLCPFHSEKTPSFSVNEGKQFYHCFGCGKGGSAKTQICTAICSRLMEQNKNVRYMLWRDETVLLKALTTDGEEYQSRIRPFKSVPVLYIDDFLKGGHTDADIRLAFEILNSRYNDSRLRTIISSELTLFEILGLDEAVGGRIYERSRGYVLEAPRENWRLKHDE